jgi:hypothetical protein
LETKLFLPADRQVPEILNLKPKAVFSPLDNSFILDYMINESYNHGGDYG